jgi:hypothetical protein
MATWFQDRGYRASVAQDRRFFRDRYVGAVLAAGVVSLAAVLGDAAAFVRHAVGCERKSEDVAIDALDV